MISMVSIFSKNKGHKKASGTQFIEAKIKFGIKKTYKNLSFNSKIDESADTGMSNRNNKPVRPSK